MKLSTGELMNKVVFAHPTGNANSRAALTGLCDASLLSEFHTSVAMYSGNLWSKLSKLPLCGELKRRCFDDQARPYTRHRAIRELGRIIASKANLDFLTRRERGVFSVEAVYRDIDRRVARSVERQKGAAVYAYEDGALESFRTAKRNGVRCIYDLPIGYWKTQRRLLSEESNRWPEWSSTLTSLRDSPGKLAFKDEELRLADKIYVASRFTKWTLEDFDGTLAPIEVIPYGFPPAEKPRSYDGLTKRRLKLLFVGGLSQRKGIADMFSAVDQVKDEVELTVVGKSAFSHCRPLNEALQNHRWIPSLPHSDVISLMREHDVLLFPSLFEGFGLVITEAMSQGTAVITTDRTAGPDLIEHGKNGWIIPAGSTEALLTQIQSLLNDRDQVASAGEQARQSAIARPWQTYGDELAASIRHFLSE
ncbi:glycosyltransferase family 4 protein [Roseiconus lacunae]|uniref:glycosyltransferase family 4 protein n=1 Tax=Roseiconus lacunae TaxID=2605694 RepID=UPI001E4E105E|nr:glycosyltransferase family 4 protein [Roseiconus lacunae]MCD0460336.1 glycosyltransferase family 4 protein [Roseiconus lacunae]